MGDNDAGQMRRVVWLLSWISVAFSDVFCPEGKGQNTYGHCFRLETIPRTWNDAERFCSKRGGHLTSIHSQFDNEIIQGLGVYSSCTNYWTGGRCRNSECMWIDGLRTDFSSWNPGQPNSKKSCISSSFSNGMWDTTNCNKKLCFVCETSQAMTDCADWYKLGFDDDGEYTIHLNNVSYKVYCDMKTADGGWTVFQRRVDGNESFWDRNWNDYKKGFGYTSKNPQNSNFWMGNELLHQLTAKDPDVTLMVEMNGDRTPGAIEPTAYLWNQYTMFQVGPESSNYTLHNLTVNWKSIHGNASNGWYDLTASVGAAFSTVDRISDPEPRCVTQFKMGGWWLRNCAFATLNGEYEISNYTNGYGMFWIVNGLDYVVHPRKTAMKLRPTRT